MRRSHAGRTEFKELMLSFQLLGAVSLFKNGQPLSQFRSQKEVALLIYLAQTGQSHQREFMADLLWEDRTTPQALSNLRTVLARLHKQVGDALVVSRKTLALAAASQQQVDAVVLRQSLATIGLVDTPAKAATLRHALDAYRGDFLADFHLPDAPQFEHWMITTREQIRRQVIGAYDKLGQYALATGAVDDGIALAQRWLDVDALDEAAHTLLIRLLLEAHQTGAAVAHYNYCAELLRKELDIAPPTALMALIKNVLPSSPALRQPDVGQPPSAVLPAIVKQTVSRPHHNLPAPHDQFFGRIATQQAIGERLDQPWCRLVTLVGHGGVGKTRLATTVAHSRLQHYQDGVWLVELAEIDRSDANLAEAIAVEIATVLDLRLSGSTTPVEQLLSHLQHKTMLLVLDNFEHLLEGGVQLVLDLLACCERVQLLVTSRELLRTRAEWTVMLTGLGYPADAMDAAPTDAVDLFVARRAQGRQDVLAPNDLMVVRQICRLVEGLPLAIELAAALTHRTPLPTIVNELRDGFDALTTSLRDVPHRHRSLQIVFAMSWRTLTHPLQTRLARLSVFRGGFTEIAAQAVADADADQLTTLIAKSLLAHDEAAGRYALHPVVRTYAAAELTPADPIAQKHAHYYLTLLAGQSAMLQKDAPQHAVAALELEMENVRLAWQTGLAHPSTSSTGSHPEPGSEPVELLAVALTSLSIYYQLRGLSHEAEATMQTTLRTATAWGAAGLALATRSGLERARFQNRLGRYRAALETLETALRHAQMCGDRWSEGMGHVLWGEALWRLGEYAAAQTRLTHALTVAHAIGSTLLIGWCHHHLGVIDDIQSRYAAAHDHLDQACAAWRSLENMQLLSNSLNSIGLVCYHQGNLPAAQQAMEEALTLCNQLDNRHLQALLLNNLSMISTEQGDYLSAHHYLQLGLELAHTNGDLAAQGSVYTNLGNNYRLLGKTGLAVESLEEGVQISESIGNLTLMATALFYLAETSREADPKRAESLYRQALRIARQHNLQHIECEVLIGMAEFLSKYNESEASQSSAQAVTLAETLQNQNFLERATAINHYLRITQM